MVAKDIDATPDAYALQDVWRVSVSYPTPYAEAELVPLNFRRADPFTSKDEVILLFVVIVFALMKLVKREDVFRVPVLSAIQLMVDGRDVKEPDPGAAPLIEETQRSNELMVLVVILLATKELVNIWKEDREDGREVKEPDPGRAPLIEETQRSKELIVCDVIDVALIKLVKREDV